MTGSDFDTAQERAIAALQRWYDNERPSPHEEPLRYVVCAGLAVTEQMRAEYPLQRDRYITAGNQVVTSGTLIRTILARYGEKRIFLREGGRTTRRTVVAAEGIADELNAVTGLSALSHQERIAVIDDLQGWLADRAKAHLNRKRIEIDVQIQKAAPQIVADIIEASGTKAGAVAQHLVGAKLAIRYREAGIQIENHSYTTADQQLVRPGDFSVNDAVYHVTMRPTPEVITKCDRNIRNGKMPHLVVPEDEVGNARAYARTPGLDQNIGIFSIESFVGQNMEELGAGRKQLREELFRELLAEYNRRVDAIETDKSLLFEIPEHLL